MNNLPSHIFIVGVGRSGTKFLMNVLNNHSKISIAPETHFFSTLLHNGVVKNINKIGDLRVDTNLEKLVDWMYSDKIFGTFWKEPVPVSKTILMKRLKKSNRTKRAIFDIIIEEYRKLSGKPIGGEKTPSHIYHVDTLIKWFPNAKVIHIVRDPRSVLDSEINKNLKPDYPIKKRGFIYNAGLLFYVWLQWFLSMRLDSKYLKKYKDEYYSIRYEDLFKHHEKTVEEIFLFLKVAFESKTLHPKKVDSSFLGNTNKNDISNFYHKTLSFLLKRKMKQKAYLR